MPTKSPDAPLELYLSSTGDQRPRRTDKCAVMYTLLGANNPTRSTRHVSLGINYLLHGQMAGETGREQEIIYVYSMIWQAAVSRARDRLNNRCARSSAAATRCCWKNSARTDRSSGTTQQDTRHDRHPARPLSAHTSTHLQELARIRFAGT